MLGQPGQRQHGHPVFLSPFAQQSSQRLCPIVLACPGAHFKHTRTASSKGHFRNCNSAAISCQMPAISFPILPGQVNIPTVPALLDTLRSLKMVKYCSSHLSTGPSKCPASEPLNTHPWLSLPALLTSVTRSLWTFGTL